MANISTNPSSASGKKSLDAEINLVPFIDLLSMCICFLLMTAVWMEIGGVDVKQLVGTEAAPSTSTQAEMDVKYVSPMLMEVQLKVPGAKGLKFKVEGETSELRLNKLRDVVKGAISNQKVSLARITTKAGVNYGEIVSVMDALRGLGIGNLGLVPVRE
jgi:biopolymer transport protein TolR